MMFSELFKWRLFLLLKSLNSIKGTSNSANVSRRSRLSGRAIPSDECIWLFCSTIGELNACKPMIDDLSRRYKLVLLTDREGYREAYRKACPNAVVVEMQVGDSTAVVEYLNCYIPKALILCEIPCLPSDAPCRLSYEIIRLFRSRGAKIALVNGWLYDYKPSCKEDVIERWLFTKNYLKAFDLITVQSDEIRERIVSMGAKSEVVFKTGNMKFDVLSLDQNFTSHEERGELGLRDRWVLVAGCLAEEWEYRLLIECYSKISKTIQGSCMIIAPRHPDNKEHMSAILKYLEEHQISWVKKSARPKNGWAAQYQVLILDTIGELKKIYSAATVAYVGRNHNVLEPLSFGKRVVVSSGWERTYPSYPVYRASLDADLIYEAEDLNELCTYLESVHLDNFDNSESRISNELRILSGAYKENMRLIDKILN